ncbi:hypothetical protein L873DRAFT_1796680, partial [Choiromyces venosus 120613-1]
LVVTLNTLNSKSAVFTKIFEYTDNNNCKPFEYKSKISRNILNSRSVVVKSEVFTSLLNTKLVIESIVTANLFNIVTTNLLNFKLEVFSNFLKISKQELFANLLNSKPVVESVVTAKPVNNKSRCLPIFFHITANLLNLTAEVFKNILNSKSVVVNSEVFTNLLNTKSVIVSGVTINLLNSKSEIFKKLIYIIENILNISKSKASSNCKCFEYESLVDSVVIANIWNSNSEVFKNILNTIQKYSQMF